MSESEAVAYVSDLLSEEVLTVESVLCEISEAPYEVKRFLRRQCRTAEEMEEFLKSHDEYFIVENGRATTYDSILKSGRDKAVDYFKEELDLYDTPPNFMNFRGHVGQADEDVIDFINCFYPKEEFRNFLLEYPDVFVLFDDDTVYLIENESVEYFDECLNTYGEGLHYMRLRGHVSQAPDHVLRFINRYYPGKKFIEFLENNSDVFILENGYVYINPDE